MNTPAAAFMVRDLTAIAEDDSVLEAVRVMYSQRISGIPVVRDNWYLVGYLSETDILRAAVPTYLEVLAQSTFLEDSEGSFLDRLKVLAHRKVSDFMSVNLIAVEPTTSLMTVADLMLRKRIKRLPVSENGKLVGIIDRGAFCEFMMEAETFDERTGNKR
ncbi:CBS domain-containing protein [Aminiphilus circumscriptus]|jgi:CBS domain-containing protein|uniref:CBS domain-containing protein n=1 Tax=Aminiphilus circumscriptus TaxID=290732 RepID=UPI000492460C|nr:CBS domain-containing protein [Aminiphilus circumscriptus]